MYVMFKKIYEELKRRYCTVLSRVSTMTLTFLARVQLCHLIPPCVCYSLTDV